MVQGGGLHLCWSQERSCSSRGKIKGHIETRSTRATMYEGDYMDCFEARMAARVVPAPSFRQHSPVQTGNMQPPFNFSTRWAMNRCSVRSNNSGSTTYFNNEFVQGHDLEPKIFTQESINTLDNNGLEGLHKTYEIDNYNDEITAFDDIAFRQRLEEMLIPSQQRRPLDEWDNCNLPYFGCGDTIIDSSSDSSPNRDVFTNCPDTGYLQELSCFGQDGLSPSSDSSLNTDFVTNWRTTECVLEFSPFGRDDSGDRPLINPSETSLQAPVHHHFQPKDTTGYLHMDSEYPLPVTELCGQSKNKEISIKTPVGDSRELQCIHGGFYGTRSAQRVPVAAVAPQPPAVQYRRQQPVAVQAPAEAFPTNSLLPNTPKQAARRRKPETTRPQKQASVQEPTATSANLPRPVQNNPPKKCGRPRKSQTPTTQVKPSGVTKDHTVPKGRRPLRKSKVECNRRLADSFSVDDASPSSALDSSGSSSDSKGGMDRKLKNRLAARKCRDKKKQQFTRLEQELEVLLERHQVLLARECRWKDACQRMRELLS